MFGKLQFPIIAAPMAGVTDQPFRRILRKLNPETPIMTEMISCHSITAKGGGRNDDTYFGENTGAQIFGAEPVLMAEAARILESRGAAWIDINMGCPVPKVATRAGAGAFLMRDHKLAGEIMRAVARAVKIPVSIKTRLGWDEKHLDAGDLLRIAAESGIGFATVHARTRADGYAGKADWAAIPTPENLPIIFNGDIKTRVDIDAVKKLGANGAMIGRAMLGTPYFFTNPESRIANPDIIAEHFELMLSYYGKQGVPMFRKHAAWYAAGRSGANRFRQQANQISDAIEMRKAIKDFFS
ncbi:MAG: tRNA-dihydrouridine synthase [Rickettsiales bacterium]|jgi:tRNA-dihydrouridine synthase B|nr:tRNA-dihydrouridine synthase [Rickettsiales bacterium]